MKTLNSFQELANVRNDFSDIVCKKPEVISLEKQYEREFSILLSKLRKRAERYSLEDLRDLIPDDMDINPDVNLFQNLLLEIGINPSWGIAVMKDYCNSFNKREMEDKYFNHSKLLHAGAYLANLIYVFFN